MKDIALLVAKNGVQIGIFLYFHRDNSFNTISSINFMTFFLILISYLFRQNIFRSFSSSIADPEMVLFYFNLFIIDLTLFLFL